MLKWNHYCSNYEQEIGVRVEVRDWINALWPWFPVQKKIYIKIKKINKCCIVQYHFLIFYRELELFGSPLPPPSFYIQTRFKISLTSTVMKVLTQWIDIMLNYVNNLQSKTRTKLFFCCCCWFNSTLGQGNTSIRNFEFWIVLYISFYVCMYILHKISMKYIGFHFFIYFSVIIIIIIVIIVNISAFMIIQRKCYRFHSTYK